MSSKQTYKLGPIANHLLSSGQRIHLHWLGDSQSAPTASPRWAQGIVKQWTMDWRRRILFKDGSVSVSVGDEGWQTFANTDSQVAVGATLSDGVTTVPNGFLAGEEYYALDASNFVPFYRMETRGYGDAIGGNWLVDQPIQFRLAMLKLDAGANMTQIRPRCRFDGADGGNTQTINLETALSTSSDWQALDINFAASATLTNKAELFIDNGGVDDASTGAVIGAVSIGVQGKTDGFCLSFDAEGGWQTTDHIPDSDGGERTDLTNAAIAARFDLYEWPTVIAIQIGQNSATGEGTSGAGLELYKTNVLKIIDNYLSAYSAAGEDAPYFMLVGNWETSKGNAAWDALTDKLEEICDERSNTGLLNLFAIVNDTHGTFATWNGTYLADQIHQNAAGAEEFARLAFEALEASQGYYTLTGGLLGGIIGRPLRGRM